MFKMHALHLSVFVLICFGISLIYAANRPPNIYIQSSEKEIFYQKGERMEILCVADGIPAPKYLWKRNGKPYNLGDQGGRVDHVPNQGTIVFSSTVAEDEGIYQCFADNGYGTSASIKINLRMARLEAFFTEPNRIHKVEAGEPLTLPCVPPASYPPASIVWVLNERRRHMKPFYLDKRVSLDLEGRLHFTNVKKSDEQRGRTYSCMAVNHFMRAHSIGPEHVLKVTGPKRRNYPPQILWTSHSYHVILRGEKLKLKCIFAGKPTPNVYWKKVGGTFPERAQYMSYGQELDINNIQESDAGQYMCMNQITESTQTLIQNFYVKIESAPYWVEEPANVEINANKNATFICNAGGDPKPEYAWYINGVPIEGQSEDRVRDPRIYNNNRFYKKDTNSIELVNVTVDDLMNIQCNASNKHGYVFSDVYLNVHLNGSAPEKPTIITPPPTEIKVAESKPVTLDCLVTGNPYPKVTWYRYEMVIYGGRFQIMPNGNLNIQEARMADAGDFHCRARNVHGEVTSSTCNLIIRRKTRIQQRPLDRIIIAGENVRFICSGITDVNEVENLEVYWEKDDVRVSTNESRLTQNEENSLTIWGAIVRDSGVYTCVVTNGLDEDRASAVLTVKDQPDPPSGVEIERCLASSADIKWIKGAENNSPGLSFIVQYNTSLNPDQWISAKTVNYTHTTTTVILHPWGNYTFRVIATNVIGASYPSYQTKTVCRTPATRPDTNPQNVRSIRDTRNMLKIQWTPMNESEYNGPGFKYQLTVKEAASTTSYTYSIADWRQDTIEIPANYPYKPYQVKLQAKNYLGDSVEEPQEYTLYSFEDVPNVRPVEVEVTEVGTTFATVTWNWDSLWLEERGEITEIHGQLKGFKIQYRSTNEMSSTFQEAEIPLAELMPKYPPPAGKPMSSFYLLKNLPQFNNMQVQVRVYNNFYDGPPSDSKEFFTFGVNRPPKINTKFSNKDIYFNPGERVAILCEANGIPRPKYLWKRNGEPYDPNGHGDRVAQLLGKGTIVFNSTGVIDEGIYQCFADNGYGISVSDKVYLRMAKLGQFADEPGVTHTVRAGNHLTLPCLPPPSYPPAAVFWMLKEPGEGPGERWQPIYFDNRVSLDMEGRLRFTNVIKDDEQDGRAYGCVAQNHYLRAISIGPEHFVEVLGVAQVMRQVDELWTSPSDQLFLKGETLKLKCIFTGNPTPEVMWMKINGTLPNRAIHLSFGHELQIPNIQESDAGEYECEAWNMAPTSAFKTVYVRIESAPYWIEEPKDVEAILNEEATFICKAGGDPKPQYAWYINGFPLGGQNDDGSRDPRIFDNDRFFKKDENSITLINLTQDNNMNIQCNASNKHGYVFSDVYLNVWYVMPVIIKHPPADIEVVEGSSVTLDCLVKGKPDPTITWYKNQIQIFGFEGTFQILPNGNLQIQNVAMADAGYYRCRAENMYGEVTSSTCKLQIRQPTRIEQPPQDLEVIAGNNATFTCSVSTDMDETANIEVYWEKDGTRISTNEQNMTQKVQDNSLSIWRATVRDSGVYTCVVTNGLDEDRASANLIVIDRPEAPSGVQIEECLELSADIQWIKGVENNAPIQSFIVQYNTSFYPDQWISATTVNHTQNTATVALQPWANYTFRVIATNEIGASSPSHHTTTVCRTSAAPPDRNPKDVRSIGDTRNRLKIEWTRMNELEHNGPGFKYQLTVKERGRTHSSTYIIDDWRMDVYQIRKYKPYTPYLVKLQAKNEMGYAKEDPIEYTLYSFFYIPKVRPMEVEVTDIGNKFATVTWKWDPLWLEEQGEITQILGQLKGFKIEYWRYNEMGSTFHEVAVLLEEVMPKDPPSAGMLISSSYQLKNLSQNSNIQVQVRVFNNLYVGPPSDTEGFYTFEGGNCPPNIFEQSAVKDIYYIPEQPVQLLCVANGIPKPRYLWKRNGKIFNITNQGDRISQLPGKGTISFNKPEDKDEGIYQCFADNGFGISASNTINLRMAKLGKFDRPGSTNRVRAGKDLTLPCVPPHSYPPASVFWAWKQPDDRWYPIIFDKRVTMDFLGNLRFTNVRTSDEMSGQAYHCLASNPLMRDFEVGPEHFVEVSGSTEQYYPTSELWTSASYQIFLKGETMKLKCIFAGNPTPDVRWKRLDEKLSDQARLESFGQELHIANVQESDSGEYECRDRRTTINKTIHVIIESAPNWVHEPKNVVARSNENATFFCKADSEPKPDYAWYINGVPLKDSNNEIGVRDLRIYNNARFIKRDENIITLTNLTLEDHMNIQCNASNKHGYVFSDVYLYVLGSEWNRR